MLLAAHPHDFLVAPYRSRLTSREARLLAVALACHHWEQLTERCRNAVLVGEQYADGLVDDETLLITWQTVDGVMTVNRCGAAEAVCFAAYPEIEDPVAFVRDAVLDLAADLGVSASLQCHWLACLLGPRELPALDPTWRSPTAKALATAIYRENGLEPDRVAILADALEEAGCAHAEVLGHLREALPHCRGCLVVEGLLRSEDRLLGKLADPKVAK